MRIASAFIAGLIFCTYVLGLIAMGGNSLAAANKVDPNSEERATMQLSVMANGNKIVFMLNDSQASKDLYAQLPFCIKVENYSSNEKIFYPPKKLGTADTPLAKNVRPGTLAYYAPWGDVVIFYGPFGSAAGLYELGHATSGSEHIRGMSGNIRLEQK